MTFKNLLTHDEIKLILENEKYNWTYNEGIYEIFYEDEDKEIKYTYRRYSYLIFKFLVDNFKQIGRKTTQKKK
jgi:hypothetical protein